jgi:hypothetical protein
MTAFGWVETASVYKEYNKEPGYSSNTIGASKRPPIGYMPILGPDELVYSWMSRYAWGTGSRPGAIIRRQLLGEVPKHLSVLLTGNLSQLGEVLPPGSLDADTLVENHTLYRYHAPFMSEEAAVRLRSMLLLGWEASVQGWFGSRRAVVPMTPYLSFCPACVQDDLARVGEPTWHRAHQLPGTEVCHVHGTRLRYGPWETGHTTVLQTCPRTVDLYPDRQRLLPDRLALAYAREGASLLGKVWNFGDHRRLHAAMARVVAGKGFIHKNRLQRAELEAHVRNEIGNDAMISFGLVSPSSRSPFALHVIHEVRAQSYSPPCRYLLLLAILEASLGDLEAAAQEVDLHSEAADTPRASKQHRMSVERLSLHKERLVAAMREHPGWSRIDLFTKMRASYAAVTRFDLSWWESNAPSAHARVRRQDWKHRDAVQSKLIRDAASRLEISTPPCQRITRTAVLREAGLPTSLNTSSRLMPSCHAAIAAAVRPSSKGLRMRGVTTSSRVAALEVSP